MDKKFPGCKFGIEIIHPARAIERQCLHQRLCHILAGDQSGPNLLDLVVRFDRVVEAVQQHDHPRPGLARSWTF